MTKRLNLTTLAGAVALATLAGLTNPAHAVLISVDHGVGGGSFSAAGPLGGGTWNNVSGGLVDTFTSSALLDSTGAATTVTYTTTGAGAPIDGDGFFAGGHVNTSSLLQDYRIWLNMLDVDNLTVNGSYDLVLFGTRDVNDTYSNSTFTINTVAKTATGSTDAQMATLAENVNYVRFNNIQADGTGNIHVDVAGVLWMGMQIEEVPEPASASLLIVAGVGLVAVTRRRRNC